MNFVVANERDRQELIEYVSSMLIDKPQCVKIKTRTRTLKQNGLYWSWIEDIAHHWNHVSKIDGPLIQSVCPGGLIHVNNYDRENVHKFFARRLLSAEKVEYNYPSGVKKYDVRVRSTTDLDTREFNEYMMKVRIIMMDVWNLVLETPEQNEFTKYLNSLESA